MSNYESRIEGFDQQGVGHEVHIGDGMLETGGHKSGDREDDRQNLVSHTVGRVSQPDCQADQTVAKNAQRKRLNEAQVYFPYSNL